MEVSRFKAAECRDTAYVEIPTTTKELFQKFDSVLSVIFSDKYEKEPNPLLEEDSSKDWRRCLLPSLDEMYESPPSKLAENTREFLCHYYSFMRARILNRSLPVSEVLNPGTV